MKPIKRLLIIAPEPSGDHLAAEFIDAVRQKMPDIEIKGMGGPQMALLGVKSVVSTDGLAVLGLVEALGAWQTARKKAKEIAKFALAFRPDVVVAIDSWGFTLRAGQQIRKLLPSARLVKMVGPQVWATRAGRAKVLAETYDELWCIHEFEVPFYSGLPIRIKVIGNPGLGRLIKGDGDKFKTRHNIKSNTIVGLLPGSRRKEIDNILPSMLEAARTLSANRNNLVFVTVAANAIREKLLDRATGCGFNWLIVDEHEKADAFDAMYCAMACSGTVTSELAEAGVPITVGYAIDNITYFIIRNFLIKTKYICLLNVAMGREIVKELLQSDLNGKNLSDATQKLIEDKTARQKQLDDQNQALQLMGLDEKTAAETAAEFLLEA